MKNDNRYSGSGQGAMIMKEDIQQAKRNRFNVFLSPSRCVLRDLSSKQAEPKYRTGKECLIVVTYTQIYSVTETHIRQKTLMIILTVRSSKTKSYTNNKSRLHNHPKKQFSLLEILQNYCSQTKDTSCIYPKI